MAKKSKYGIDIPRLIPSMRKSGLMLRKPREYRREAVRQYIGYHFSEEGATDRVIVNLLSLFVRITLRSLIANDPQVLLSTTIDKFRPAVSAMEDWVNSEIQRIHLGDSLQRMALDALFSIAIGKVALATPSDAANSCWNLIAGQPFCMRVDLDDFRFDPHARSFEEVGWIGHRYRVPLDTVRDNPLFTSERKNIEESQDQPYNPEGDERIRMLGATYVGGISDEYEPHCDLWELYHPRHRLVSILPDSWLSGPTGKEPLLVQRWIGCDTGPYHILGYGIVPAICMPKAPIQDLLDLHDVTNEGYRKIARILSRIKEITGVSGGADADGNRVLRAIDGQMIKMDNPERVKQFVMGGTSMQGVLAGTTVFKDLFSYEAGGMDIAGGLAPQSKTAHQDEMLNTNAAATVADMQQKTVQFTSRIAKAMSWYWWNDPLSVRESYYSPRGMPSVGVMRQVYPGQQPGGPSVPPGALTRGIPFDRIGLKVNPYSLPHQTPQQKLQGLMGVMKEIVLPMMPTLQQQGITTDLHEFLDMVAEYGDLPELRRILTFREPPQAAPGGGGGGQAPGSPQPETTRNYVRESHSDRTPQGTNRDMVQRMIGQNPGGNPSTTKSPAGAGVS